jgi:DHA3 family tetracycline resistance protein-like MFS transporter
MKRQHNRVRHADPYKLYLVIELVGALCMAVYGTLAAVYRVRTAGLNPLELVLIGTALEASTFVFQVPTGLVADVFSRRLSIILGFVLVGAGFALEGAVSLFPVMLLAQVIWGLGYTFTSGAQEAWIADEVGETRAAQVYVGGAQAGQVGALLGIPLAVALASVRLNLPLIAGGAGMVALGVVLIPLMSERGFRPTPREERSSWRQMGDTLRGSGRLVRRSPVLLTILGIGLFYGLYNEAVDRLWETHFLKDIGFPTLGGVTPVVWLGAIDAAAVLLSLAAMEVVRRRVDAASHVAVARALFVMTGLMVFCLVAFGLAATFALGVAAYLGFSLLHEPRARSTPRGSCSTPRRPSARR